MQKSNFLAKPTRINRKNLPFSEKIFAAIRNSGKDSSQICEDTILYKMQEKNTKRYKKVEIVYTTGEGVKQSGSLIE